MIQYLRKSRSGFTLIELAIVLAIAGLLFSGLWRLMSGGNQQLRDQAAASSQSQVLSAVKGYLASSEGNTFLTNMAANATQTLPLPASAANSAGSVNCSTTAPMAAPVMPGAPGLCNFLPAGFWSGTVNSYGQSYSIRVMKDSQVAGKPPNTYSFMILTKGGDPISDMSGGRITAMIGGDGGFIYGSAVCTGAVSLVTSCGAYGAWSARIDNAAGGYNFPALPATGGYIATRTYYSPEQSSTNVWLARVPIAGDVSFSFNTMNTDMFMDTNQNGAHAGRSNIYMAPDAVTATGGGSLNVAQGTVNMQGGTLNMNVTGTNNTGGNLNLQGGNIYGTTNTIATPYSGSILNTVSILTGANVAADTPLEVDGIANPVGHVNPVGYGGALCVMNGNSGGEAATCGLQLQVQGNASVSGLLSAFSLYSKTFVYDAGGIVSDMRMKKDIQPLGSELDKLTKLKTVSFTRLSTNTEGLGFLAQDVEKTYPQLIVDAGDGMKAVDYTGLIAPAVQSIRELKTQNEMMKKEIDLLKLEIKALQAKQP